MHLHYICAYTIRLLVDKEAAALRTEHREIAIHSQMCSFPVMTTSSTYKTTYLFATIFSLAAVLQTISGLKIVQEIRGDDAGSSSGSGVEPLRTVSVCLLWYEVLCYRVLLLYMSRKSVFQPAWLMMNFWAPMDYSWSVEKYVSYAARRRGYSISVTRCSCAKGSLCLCLSLCICTFVVANVFAFPFSSVHMFCWRFPRNCNSGSQTGYLCAPTPYWCVII